MKKSLRNKFICINLTLLVSTTNLEKTFLRIKIVKTKDGP